MDPALREACARAIHVVTGDGRVLRAGRAALFILERIGFPLSAKVLRLPPMIWFVELGYWFVARNRVLFSRFFFRSEG